MIPVIWPWPLTILTFCLFAPLENDSLKWRRHHCRWRAANCWSTFFQHLRALSIAGRDLYRATLDIFAVFLILKYRPNLVIFNYCKQDVMRTYSNLDTPRDEHTTWKSPWHLIMWTTYKDYLLSTGKSYLSWQHS